MINVCLFVFKKPFLQGSEDAKVPGAEKLTCFLTIACSLSHSFQGLLWSECLLSPLRMRRLTLRECQRVTGSHTAGGSGRAGPTPSTPAAVLRPPSRPLSLHLAWAHSGQLSSSVCRQLLSASVLRSVKQANGLDTTPASQLQPATHGWVGGRLPLHSWSV